jgi:hypothetical protein
VTSRVRGETRPIAGLAIVVMVLGLLAASELAVDTDVESETGILIAIVLVALISGLLVARRPSHPVSWLLAIAAVMGAVAGVSAELLPPGVSSINDWQALLAIVSGPSWYGLLVTIVVLMPLLFPTGSPPSKRWRWVGWAAVAAFGLMALLWALQERFCTDSGDNGCLVSVANPIGVGGLANPEDSAMGAVFYGIMLICSVAALASLVVRFRRAVGVERQQIKWVLFSVGVFVGFTLIVDVVWIETLGGSEPPGYWLVQQALWVMIPLSVALAILRYRLYDLDRIISRTVSYALVVALLALLALALVALLALFLPSDDPLVVAVATLAAAALFNPLRLRIQRVVDRRFNRTRYVSERVIDDFAGSLRDRVDPDGVVDGWLGVVEETIQPVAVGVWLR